MAKRKRKSREQPAAGPGEGTQRILKLIILIISGLAAILTIAAYIFAAGGTFRALINRIEFLEKKQQEHNQKIDAIEKEIEHHRQQIDSVRATIEQHAIVSNTPGIRGSFRDELQLEKLANAGKMAPGRLDGDRERLASPPGSRTGSHPPLATFYDLGEIDPGDPTGAMPAGHSNAKKVNELDNLLAPAFDKRVRSHTALAGLNQRAGGKRDPESVRDVILKHNPAIQDCYGQLLRSYPDLKGELVIRFEVGAEGRLTNPEVIESSLAPTELADCILEKMRHWNDFGEAGTERSENSYRLTYTFGY